MSNFVLQTRELQKTYTNGPQEVPVLRGVDLEVEAGEIVVIMGPSGVGKSTLLHVVGGLDKPSGGEVLITGKNLFNLAGRDLAVFRNNEIGFVFQFHHLLTEFTALENVLLPAIMYRERDDQLEEKAVEILSAVGLANRLDHKPRELSGGEQQRVAIARALINQPKLVLADEPTGNLDRHNSEGLYELILDLNKKFNQTFLIVTHNEMMTTRANRVIEMNDGVISNHIRQ